MANNTINRVNNNNKEATCFLKDYITKSNIEIGDYTIYHDFCNPYDFERNNVLYHYSSNNDKLKIGKFCSIANGAKFIMNGANHTMKSFTNYPFPVLKNELNIDFEYTEAWDNKGDIIIGNDVWIGFEAIIYAGVKIGDGAVIASRAVVSKDVEAFTIVGGIPAKYIKQRFSDEVCELLTKLQWWDWNIEKIKANAKFLVNGDFETLKQYL